MHVLLVGATSHLARTLVPALIASPFIHRIVLLSRTSAPSAILQSSKVTQIVHADFNALPTDLFERLRDDLAIKAVIWCIGGSTSRFKNLDEAREANVSLPLRFLESCIEHGLVPTPSGLGGSSAPTASAAGKKGRYASTADRKQPFRFVYYSTYNAEQDSFRSLWQAPNFRKMKGAAEKALLGLADEKGQGMLEVYCLRLGKVLDGGQSVANVVWEGMGGYVSDQLVAARTVALCVDGRGRDRGGGVLELEEVLGEGWADINVVR